MSTTLNKDTKITIGFAMAVLSGIAWLLAQQFEVNKAIYEIQRDVMEARRDIEELRQGDGSKITRSEISSIFQLLQAKNPELKIPEIR